MMPTLDIQSTSTCNPPPPPPVPPPPPPAPPLTGSSSSEQCRLPQQQTPRPRAQLKRLPWNKISVNQVVNSDNIWTEVGRQFDGYSVDFDQIERLFSVQLGPSASSVAVEGDLDASERTTTVNGSVNGCSEVEGTTRCRAVSDIRRRPTEINVIDSKRSMNINIFLRQFQGMSPSDIVKCLLVDDDNQLAADKLRFLQQILPQPDDVQKLTQYNGSRDCLGLAEKFYLELMAVPNCNLLVDALLVRAEFHQVLQRVKPALKVIITSAHDIKQNPALHELIYMVLITGNFLNAGYYGGNAAGFQLNSLIKLTEIRANKPGMNLMHYVAQEAAEKNPNLLHQLTELKHLHEAPLYPLDAIMSDVKLLGQQVKSVSDHTSQTDEMFQQRITPFLHRAEGELNQLAADLKEIENLRVELAEYFCEDVKTFRIDDCLSTFSTFCQKFIKATQENVQRNAEQEKAEQRRLLRLERKPSNNLHQEVTLRNSGSFIDAAEIRRTRSSEGILGDRSSQGQTVTTPTIVEPIRQTSCVDDKTLRDADELETLLRGSDLRRSGSFRRSRSRASAGLSTELLAHRERSVSPHPLTSPLATANSPRLDAPDDVIPAVRKDFFIRGSVARSSCPSRTSTKQVTNRVSEAENVAPQPTVDRIQTPETNSSIKQTIGEPSERQSQFSVKTEKSSGLSSSSYNLLSPCINLLSNCSSGPSFGLSETAKNGSGNERQRSVNRDITGSSRPDTQLGSRYGRQDESELLSANKTDVRQTTSLPTQANSESYSDSLQRRPLIRKDRFKRLSELYSDVDNDVDSWVTSKNRNSTGQSQIPGYIEPNEQNAYQTSTGLRTESYCTNIESPAVLDTVECPLSPSACSDSVNSYNDEGFVSDFGTSASQRSSIISQVDSEAAAVTSPRGTGSVRQASSQPVQTAKTSTTTTTKKLEEKSARGPRGMDGWSQRLSRLMTPTKSSARRGVTTATPNDATKNEEVKKVTRVPTTSTTARSRSTPPAAKTQTLSLSNPTTASRLTPTTTVPDVKSKHRMTSSAVQGLTPDSSGAFVRGSAARTSVGPRTVVRRDVVADTGAALVRGAGGRATMPANVLGANKRAAKVDSGKDVPFTRRATSVSRSRLKSADDAAGDRGTGDRPASSLAVVEIGLVDETDQTSQRPSRPKKSMFAGVHQARSSSARAASSDRTTATKTVKTTPDKSPLAATAKSPSTAKSNNLSLAASISGSRSRKGLADGRAEYFV